MAKNSFAQSTWAPALKDAALLLSAVISLLFSLVLMGVPILAQGLGLGTDPSWQTLTISFVALLSGGYVVIEALSDVFSKNQKILQTPAGSRWKPLTAVLVIILVIFALMYSKILRGSGGGASP